LDGVGCGKLVETVENSVICGKVCGKVCGKLFEKLFGITERNPQFVGF